MEKTIVYLFTSPTCPHCPAAKKFIHEFRKTRNDFVLKDLSTATPEGARMARKYDVMSVPTFIIVGPKYQPIGLRGLQNNKIMNKYLDLSYGKITENENKDKGIFTKINEFLANYLK
ncbi:hypothetical protein D6777_00550 [Candidatus Woesearchaeota archaeon]|nr:MAG: hypothetical protein D6777_00550 [Candidatus Woesearchaeota archaeon]